MIPVVVIFGPKGSGKDAFGKRLAESLAACLPVGQRRIERRGFADPARRLTEEAIGIPPCVVGGTSAAKESYVAYGESAREHLRAATAFLRSRHPDMLAHAALRSILSAPCVGAFIFTDARRGNEFFVLRDTLVGGTPAPWDHGPTARAVPPRGLYRLVLVGIRRRRTEDASDSHVTETSFAEFDEFGPVRVENDGTLRDLLGKADALAGEIAGSLG